MPGSVTSATFPDVANVKRFGAAGDGITDDTNAIQNAISFATRMNGSAGTGGATVFFPPGIYVVRGLTIYNFIHLRGSGLEATTILLKPGANADVISTYHFSSLTGTNNVGGVVNFGVYDLTIDGNKANQTAASYGLRIYGYGYIIQNVRIRNTYSDGVYSEWASAGTASYDSMESQWSNVKVHNTGGAGINLQGPHDTQFNNVISYITGSHNFVIGPACTGFQATNAHGWGCAVGTNSVAWLIEAPVVNFVNCAAEGSDTMQVVCFATSKFSWIGGAIFSGNVNGGNNTNGIQLGQAAGKATPYKYSANQLNGATTQVWVTAYNINTLFDKCQGPLGTVYFEQDGGYGIVAGQVFFDTTKDWYSYSSVCNPPGALTNATGFTHSTSLQLIPQIPYTNQDGSVQKGGCFQIPVRAFKAVTFSNAMQDIFNFNTWFGPVPRCEFPNGCELRTYSDNYITRSFAASHGKFAVLESSTSLALVNNGTIPTSGLGVSRVNPTAAVTGAILEAGTTDANAMSGGGLLLTIQNESAFSITFDVTATSNVADGSGSVIAPLRSALFQWSAKKSLWYRIGS